MFCPIRERQSVRNFYFNVAYELIVHTQVGGDFSI